MLLLLDRKTMELGTHENSSKTQTSGRLVVRAWRGARVACRDETVHREDVKAQESAEASLTGAASRGLGSDVLQDGSLDASWSSTDEQLLHTRPGAQPAYHGNYTSLG